MRMVPQDRGRTNRTWLATGLIVDEVHDDTQWGILMVFNAVEYYADETNARVRKCVVLFVVWR